MLKELPPLRISMHVKNIFAFFFQSVKLVRNEKYKIIQGALITWYIYYLICILMLLESYTGTLYVHVYII